MNWQELSELSNLRILPNLPIDPSIQILEYFPVTTPFLCMQWYFRFPRGLWTNFNGPFSIFGMQFLQIWNWCFVHALLSHFSFKQGCERDLVSGLKKIEMLRIGDPWLNCSCFTFLPAAHFLFWIFRFGYNSDLVKFWVNKRVWFCPF